MISAILQRAVTQFGSEVAVEESGQTWTYQILGERVARLAGLLRQQGLCRGDRVAILAPNSLLYVEAYFAAAWADLVLVPLNHWLSPLGLETVVTHSGSKAVLVHPELQERASELARRLPDLRYLGETERASASQDDTGPIRPLPPEEVPPEAPAQIYYTSGTTGDPKGVVLSHRNVCSHAMMAAAALSLRDTDVFGHIAPMFHLADAWATFAITAVGGRHRMVRRLEAAAVCDELAGGVTLTNLVPTMLGDLLHHPASRRSYPSLRVILSGGAPIAPALVEQIVERFGCRYVQTYGLTETSPFLTMSTLPRRLRERPPEEQLFYASRTGRPLAGVDLRVVTKDGEDIARDGKQVGEIIARGDSVFAGYYLNPAATALAFEGAWFRTGDLATWDAEGFLQIVDRSKDVILSGGETIYSTEIEAVLYRHEAVQAAAVFGVPHERWGEAVVAALVTRDDAATEAEILAHCRAILGRHQVPKRVLFLPGLPRTGSGKIAKKLLREAHAGLFVRGDDEHR